MEMHEYIALRDKILSEFENKVEQLYQEIEDVMLQREGAIKALDAIKQTVKTK